MLVVCEPGVYQLQTGQGPLDDDPGCGSSHCELLQQPNLATLVVVSKHPQIAPAGSCCNRAGLGVCMLSWMRNVSTCCTSPLPLAAPTPSARRSPLFECAAPR